MAAKSFRVGIICGSQRVVRVCPQITAFVADVIRSEMASSPADAPSIHLDMIDIAALGLPLCDEPGVPSQIHSADGYEHEHTRTWSRRIAALDGFVIVTPQYNWGLPAGLKNAIDYLYHEWAGKPAMVVAYGGHGGGKAAAALHTVLQGLDMRPIEPPVLLTFPDRQVLGRAAAGKDIGLTEPGSSLWADRRADIARAWAQVVSELQV